MEVLENLIASLDYILNTNRKRHITGGILLSISTLFGGLAITVMTIRKGENEDE
ncbi:MAG: histidine kinase [Clostridia bacterium]|nr:histidine kinase [Clostridia bacterium]